MGELTSKERGRSGVVTFLDVLGWKGVYDRQTNAIDKLTGMIEGLRLRAPTLQRGRILGEIAIKSISDTIAIFTFCSDAEISSAIEVHGELCQWLIPESIRSELPMRGATAFGEFEISESIFVGKAIDEAASWHEQSDWIGVHLTPSAEFVFTPSTSGSVWRPFNPPNKTRLNWKLHCVNWTADWSNRPDETRLIKESFRRLGPIVPEIAGKFANTLAFVTEMAPAKPRVP